MKQGMGFVLREGDTGATVASSIETVKQVREREHEERGTHDVIVERLKERLEQLIREVEKKYRELDIGWIREVIEKRLEEARKCLEGECSRGRISSLTAELSMLSKSIEKFAPRIKADKNLKELLSKVDEPHLQRFVIRMIIAGNIESAIDAVKRRLAAKHIRFSGEQLYRMLVQLVDRIFGVKSIEELYEKLDKMGSPISTHYKPLVQKLIERVKEGDITAFRQLVAVLHNIRRISMAKTPRGYSPAGAAKGSDKASVAESDGNDGILRVVKWTSDTWEVFVDKYLPGRKVIRMQLFRLKGIPRKIDDGIYMLDAGESALFRSRLDGVMIYVDAYRYKYVLANKDYDKVLKEYKVPATKNATFIAERAVGGLSNTNMGIIRLGDKLIVVDVDAVDYERELSGLQGFKVERIQTGGYLRNPLVQQVYLLYDVLDVKVGGVTYRIPLDAPFDFWGCDKPNVCKYPPMIAISVTPAGYRMTIYVPRDPASLDRGFAKLVLEYGGGQPRKYRVVYMDKDIERVYSHASKRELRPGDTAQTTSHYNVIYYATKPILSGSMKPTAAIEKRTIMFFIHGAGGAKPSIG